MMWSCTTVAPDIAVGSATHIRVEPSTSVMTITTRPSGAWVPVAALCSPEPTKSSWSIPRSSCSSVTRSPVTRSMNTRHASERAAAQAAMATIPTSCDASCEPEAECADQGAPKMPTDRAPQAPHAPCTLTAPSGSSTRIRSSSEAVPSYNKEATIPITRDAQVGTTSHPAVIATRPEMAQLHNVKGLAMLCLRTIDLKQHVRAAAAGHTVVTTMMRPTTPT
mmetsp:Transcript_16133/g.47009  ORF Transcript_16133/g.47009 Transcript_16133/m.47009 type:complete len:222 (+) Transcript_16133:1949-2614(+)